MGYSGANGVYCLAKGFQHKHSYTGHRGTVYTADTNKDNIDDFKSLLAAEELLDYVHVVHGTIDEHLALYQGHIDMLAEDMDGSTRLETIDKALAANAPWVYVSENTLGVGANHAIKYDYGRMMKRHAALYNVDSNLNEVNGRAFSVFVRPELYKSLRSRYGTTPCPPNIPATDAKKIALNYRGWAARTHRLAKMHGYSVRCIWDIVTCDLGTLCDTSCNRTCS